MPKGLETFLVLINCSFYVSLYVGYIWKVGFAFDVGVIFGLISIAHYIITYYFVTTWILKFFPRHIANKAGFFLLFWMEANTFKD